MQSQVAIAVQNIFMALMLIMVLARFWIMRHQPRSRSLLLSDVFLIAAATQIVVLVCMTTYKISRLIELANNGTPQAEVEVIANSPYYLKLLYASAILYTTGLWTVKAAFLCFYWGLFRRIQGKVRWLLNIAIALTVSCFLVAEIGVLTWCHPIEINWGSDLAEYAACAPAASDTWTMTAAAINILNDVMLLIVPLSILPTLQISRREIAALALVFAVGLISIIAAITRTAIVHGVLTSTNAGQNTQRELETWSYIEMSLATVAFCLPAFRILFVRVSGGSKVITPSAHSHTRSWGGSRIPTAKSKIAEYELEENGSQEQLQPGIHVSHDVQITHTAKA